MSFFILDLSMNDDTLLKQIVPSGYSPQILSEEDNDNNRMVPNVDDKVRQFIPNKLRMCN